jgi:hypothetical protein
VPLYANSLAISLPVIFICARTSVSDIFFIVLQEEQIMTNDIFTKQYQIHETVPEEYQKCMVGMKRNLKQTLDIVETAADPKTKLQARAIANDCYKYIMDITTNGVVITDAIKYVQGKMDHLNKTEKALLQGIKRKEEGSSEESLQGEETSNGVF